MSRPRNTGVPASAGAPVFAFGQGAVAELLSGLLGEPVVVRRLCPACGSSDHGRPWVRMADGRRPAVSIAHAGALTLVGVCWGGRLGVDLEASDAAPPPGFGSVAEWVRFEAHAKATGEGLRRPAAAGFVEGATFGVLEVSGFEAAWCRVGQ